MVGSPTSFSAVVKVTGEGNDLVSRTLARCGQLHGTFQVQNNPVISRMAASQEHLPEHDERGLPVQCGSVCQTP